MLLKNVSTCSVEKKVRYFYTIGLMLNEDGCEEWIFYKYPVVSLKRLTINHGQTVVVKIWRLIVLLCFKVLINLMIGFFSQSYHLHMVGRAGGGNFFSGGLIYSLLSGESSKDVINSKLMHLHLNILLRVIIPEFP